MIVVLAAYIGSYAPCMYLIISAFPKYDTTFIVFTGGVNNVFAVRIQ